MAITRWTYRFLVVSILLVGGASDWVQSVEEHSLPEPLRTYAESQPGDLDPGDPRVLIAIAIAIMGLLGLGGLLQFMAWSRPLLVAVQISWLAVNTWSGPVVRPPIASMLNQMADFAWGAVLMMSFLPPVSGWFRPGLVRSEDEIPVRGLFILGVFAGLNVVGLVVGALLLPRWPSRGWLALFPALLFALAVAIEQSPRVQGWVLKPGRQVSEIDPVLGALQIASAAGFVVIVIMYLAR